MQEESLCQDWLGMTSQNSNFIIELFVLHNSLAQTSHGFLWSLPLWSLLTSLTLQFPGMALYGFLVYTPKEQGKSL